MSRTKAIVIALVILGGIAAVKANGTDGMNPMYKAGNNGTDGMNPLYKASPAESRNRPMYQG